MHARGGGAQFAPSRGSMDETDYHQLAEDRFAAEVAEMLKARALMPDAAVPTTTASPRPRWCTEPAPGPAPSAMRPPPKMWFQPWARKTTPTATRKASIATSLVASNCRMAEPNWNPCVHSVQPRDVIDIKASLASSAAKIIDSATEDSGGNAVLHLAGGVNITLLGIGTEGLKADMFHVM